jgi:hypothetical protein
LRLRCASITASKHARLPLMGCGVSSAARSSPPSAVIVPTTTEVVLPIGSSAEDERPAVQPMPPDKPHDGHDSNEPPNEINDVVTVHPDEGRGAWGVEGAVDTVPSRPRRPTLHSEQTRHNLASKHNTTTHQASPPPEPVQEWKPVSSNSERGQRGQRGQRMT